MITLHIRLNRYINIFFLYYIIFMYIITCSFSSNNKYRSRTKSQLVALWNMRIFCDKLSEIPLQIIFVVRNILRLRKVYIYIRNIFSFTIRIFSTMFVNGTENLLRFIHISWNISNLKILKKKAFREKKIIINYENFICMLRKNDK